MSRKKELQRSLGNRYSYERLLSDREIQRLKTHIPSDFSETAERCAVPFLQRTAAGL